MSKILVLSIPRLEPHKPPISSSIVATTCSRLGHEVVLKDLNIEFFHYCQEHNQNYFDFDKIWDQYTPATAEEDAFIDAFIELFATTVPLNTFDYVMLSVFGMSNHYFAQRLLKRIAPARTFRILVGGSGAFVSIYGQGLEPAVAVYKKHNLIDDYIKGECEVALEYYLKGEPYPGINNFDPVQIEDLDSLPLVDYQFVDLDRYNYLDGVKQIYIEGSRGCVRKCTYCDVAAFWPKYRFRSGKHIAQEIISNYERFGVRKIYFTDSLVNGSLKAFSQMCEVLSNYQYSQDIKWSGQFIFRNRRTVSPEHFEMIGKAGGDVFYVGVETGSDRVREAMGKPFTNDDIEYQLEQFHRNNLRCTFLMFPGYVTETEQDHADTVAMFARWQRYVATGTINGLELGSPLIIPEKTPLSRMVSELEIQFLNSDTTSTAPYWISGLNPRFDFVERVKRQLELYETAAKYHWPIWRFSSRVQELEWALQNFYQTRKQNPTYKTIQILQE
jgi:hypothetical protein